MKKIEKLIDDILEEDIFIEAVLSNLRKKDSDAYTKVDIKPVLIKEEIHYQFTYHYKSKVEHENIIREDFKFKILKLLREKFRQCMIFTSERDYQVLISKKGKVKIIENKPSKDKVDLAHNRSKNYILKDGEKIDFLIRLGIMDKNARVIKKRYDKFRQINRFLELVDHSMEGLKDKEEINIVDFGCGKSYLTFALYYYLVEIQGKNVNIIGLDLKKDVIDFCNKVAQDLNYENLKFIYGDIENYDNKRDIDIVVTLHACDTATDAALVKAIYWQAELILSVPCCQHEFFNKIENKSMDPILKHGVVRDKLSSIITDSLRGQLLEVLGYEVQLLEFIDMEHTPKNVLIRGKKTGSIDPAARDKYMDFKKAWNLNDIFIERELAKYNIEI